MKVQRILVVIALAVTVLTGCGSDDSAADESTTTSIATSIATSTTATPAETTITTSGSSETTSSTTTPASSTTALAGEPIDIGPLEGDIVAVVGVEFDDVLNVRDEPGVSGTIVATAGPLTDDMIAAGSAWRRSESIWYEVTVSGTTGWVNSRFVAYLGSVDDVTSAVVTTLGSTPTADSMLELGRIVADTHASVDAEVESTITVTVAPTTGDLGEVTYDVIGLADDSQIGTRLHVFATPGDGGGFTLKSVESTVLCGRGVSDGLCV